VNAFFPVPPVDPAGTPSKTLNVTVFDKGLHTTYRKRKFSINDQFHC
jgi:hypothetical protein